MIPAVAFDKRVDSRGYRLFNLKFIHLLFLWTCFYLTIHAAPNNTNTNDTRPVYTIGVLFPDPLSVRNHDPTLNNMIVSSETAIHMAKADVEAANLVPDVRLQIVRGESDENNPGRTSWATVEMVAMGVKYVISLCYWILAIGCFPGNWWTWKSMPRLGQCFSCRGRKCMFCDKNLTDHIIFLPSAVIGDIISTMTEASAGINGIVYIPQCSPASASLSLSDKDSFPYFFRTVGNVVLFGSSLVDWVSNMGWDSFALIYTNDNVGQQVLYSMLEKAKLFNIDARTQIPLYDFSDSKIEASLETLANSGSRIVVFADSNTSNQLVVLQKAMAMGLLSKGWSWILTNDMSPAIKAMVDTEEELRLYDGLMFISGLWDLSGIPAYDNLEARWKEQPIPEAYIHPENWNTSGLSYNAPNSYACFELLVRGLDKALNEYPGGREKGLIDMANRQFNSTHMTPTFYNMNYTGPAGYMHFDEAGDLKAGYFTLQYMLNGSVVTYATLKNGSFEFTPNVTILYPGGTDQRPDDIVAKYALNPRAKYAAGSVILAICIIGLVCCAIMAVLILLFRDHKYIMAASPVFCCLQLLGLALGYVAVGLYIDRPTAAKCIARQISMTLGFILVIGSIIAKNYRIYRIFQNVFTVRTSRLKSAYLMRMVAIFSFIGLCPLIVWHAIYEIKVEDVLVSPSTYCWLCVYPGADADWGTLNAAEVVVIAWGALLIICSAILAWKTRKVSGKWSETNQIAYVSYNACLAAILVTPGFFLPLNSYFVVIYLRVASILFAASFTLVVLFSPKFIFIMQYLWSNYCTKLWHDRYYHGNDSHGELTAVTCPDTALSHSSGPYPSHLLMKNLLDFSVQAHEGVLPVKKVARFRFMSIWELQHIVLVPLKRFFVLMNQSSHKAQVYHYLVCEPISSTIDRCIFRVRTDDDLTILFQVQDQIALDRWVKWFNGVTTSQDLRTASRRSSDSGHHDVDESKEGPIHKPNNAPTRFLVNPEMDPSLSAFTTSPAVVHRSGSTLADHNYESYRYDQSFPHHPPSFHMLRSFYEYPSNYASMSTHSTTHPSSQYHQADSNSWHT
ncbi:periplasmic binding protein-like I [Radiomyces spectabilis]|uniref:periplasmic binding protein-like I n=1 Tax=Radiomyces spectabilis TaxID=64574 RepID=UPI002220C142|nr:periplasmic binding protein-like I [Radiomyces spectabilis]KAI8394060.1 periplasmic binding protein-like I [Radiomyces spectabilis]